MKMLLLTTVLFMSSSLIKAQSANPPAQNGTTITITVPVESKEGTMTIGLYNEDQFMNFMSSVPLMSANPAANGDSVIVTLENVMPGSYAVLVYQDKNENKSMDFDSNGMPLEPHGTSNNVMTMGTPQWSDVKFDVGAEPIKMMIKISN